MKALLFAIGTPSTFMFTSTAILLCMDRSFGDISDSELFPGAPPIQYSSLSGPAFLANTSTSVRAVAGGTAMLSCGVRNIHNYTVSWVRGSDIRLLTANLVAYTTEPRFAASHKEGDSQWLLKIHYARLSDSGIYLCQVSTTPPITLPINLTVYVSSVTGLTTRQGEDLLVRRSKTDIGSRDINIRGPHLYNQLPRELKNAEATARVLPGHEVHVQTGSRLEIICEVEGCPPPAVLTWSRGSHTLLTTTSNAFQDLSIDNDTNSTSVVSRLTLERRLATPADSGTYSCTSACTKAVNVTVHVLRGEELAAMQHHNGGHVELANGSLLSFLVMASLLIQGFSLKDLYPFLIWIGKVIKNHRSKENFSKLIQRI
ncbi:hypothetical protein SK128_014502 [Halocaridina rubra]|uniref:Ig-like domain-containing protein n=1 Tax=Halocaridina rubra TaxID=373956 RepID=A0AAN8WL11_HALRR